MLGKKIGAPGDSHGEIFDSEASYKTAGELGIHTKNAYTYFE